MVKLEVTNSEAISFLRVACWQFAQNVPTDKLKDRILAKLISDLLSQVVFEVNAE